VEKTPLFTKNSPPAELKGETEVITRAFALKQGELGGPVETPKGIYILKVVERLPSAVPALSRIRSVVEQKVLAIKSDELARKKSEEMLPKLAKGGAALKESGSFGYSATGAIPGIGVSPELMEMAFTLTPADPLAKKAVKFEGRWYALGLKARSSAPTTALAAEKEKIRQELLPKKQQETLDSWLKGLKAKAKIEINTTLLSD
jgi:peptidyl-prolyl cis-trans isomerase D